MACRGRADRCPRRHTLRAAATDSCPGTARLSTSDQELADRAGQVAAGTCLLIVIVTSWAYLHSAPPRLRLPSLPRIAAIGPGNRASAAIPTVDNAAAHPIDAFLVERLAAAGIPPPPEADRRTLIRRATYDLHGLPPTPEEVTQFEADSAPDAYERLVDRLLASPHYGEHMARYWLDLVRYADSDGFKSDDLRPMPGAIATTSSSPSTTTRH